MQSDYQTQPENIMNTKIAAEAFQRYVVAEKIAPSGAKTKNSAVESLKKHKVLDHFSMPTEALKTILNVNTNKRDTDGNPVKYKNSWYNNLTKTLSKIAQFLTDEEKIRVMNGHYSKQISVINDHCSKDLYRYKLICSNDEQKLLDYRVNIEDLYKVFNGGKLKESREGNISQKMSERQTAAYQPHEQLLEKVMHALGEVNLNTPHGVYQYQFLAVALAWLLAYRNRRLDIIYTRLADGDDVNVVLRDDGIFIKYCYKTQGPNVLLEFKDERLKDVFKTLVAIRKKQDKDRLLLLENGGIPVDVKKWFGAAFKSVIKQLGIGENLTMGVFRLSYGIKLSQEHEGSLASEKIVQDRMGHKWSTHQKHYNLTRLESGEVVGECEDEDEDEVVAGDTLDEEAGDALHEEAGDALAEEAGDTLDEVVAGGTLEEEAGDALDEEDLWWMSD
ncbi:hypothetical protein HK104_000849 [Borealophlyctis nickersoniae]|nr:hypothetical protein HK104_000849 [Borealophlyctis nickersoniae]